MLTSSILNIAILAHIDAGKTTLSERILYLTKKISDVGEVEDGLSTLDYLPEEKRRGITIESGVSWCNWKGVPVNLIDTPGHLDFGAEVDAALQVIDVATLVISGVRQIQTQTISSWKKITQKNIPYLIFVNKLDRHESDLHSCLNQMSKEFKIEPLLLTLPYFKNNTLQGTIDLLNFVLLIQNENQVQSLPVPEEIYSQALEFQEKIVEFAAQSNPLILDQYLETQKINMALCIPTLQHGFSICNTIPVIAGSAKSNQGVRQLLNAICFFYKPQKIKEDISLEVFKVRTIEKNGLYALVKLHNTLHLKYHEFYKIHANEIEYIDELKHGDIVAWKPKENVYPGDLFSLDTIQKSNSLIKNYTPLVCSQILIQNDESGRILQNSLDQIALTDPSFQYKFDANTGDWEIETLGEVQLEIIIWKLQNEYNCGVDIGQRRVHLRETLIENSIEIENHCDYQTGQISIQFSLEKSQKKEVEWFEYWQVPELIQPELISEITSSTLREWVNMGPLCKGELQNVRIHLNELKVTGVFLPGLFKKLILDALKLKIQPDAFATLYPILNLEIHCPQIFCGPILEDLKSKNAKIWNIDGDGEQSFIKAEISLTEMLGYATWLRNISQGKASFETHYLEHRAI